MRAYGHRIGTLQGQIMLAVVYVLIVAPLALVLRLSGKQLMGESVRRWRPTRDGHPSLADLRAPF